MELFCSPYLLKLELDKVYGNRIYTDTVLDGRDLNRVISRFDDGE